MLVSFRSVIDFLNNSNSFSLREFATHHRWKDDVIPAILSFRSLIIGCKSEETRYNEVQQISSHNSYDSDGIKGDYSVQWAAGVRSFEVDLHVGEPGNWLIYHLTHVFSEGEYTGDLQDFLGKMLELHNNNPDHEIITLWFELTEDWDDDNGHTPYDLDKCIENELRGLIYTPGNLLIGYPGPRNLQEAVKLIGWPSLQSLRGKFMVVLMGDNNDRKARYLDDVNQYQNGSNNGYYGNKLCFVAPENLEFSEILLWPNAVFFNFDSGKASVLKRVSDMGLVTRMYSSTNYKDPASYISLSVDVETSIEYQSEYDLALNSHTHHIATNHVNQNLFEPLLIDECGNPFRLMEK